jgi:hypothetical protein
MGAQQEARFLLSWVAIEALYGPSNPMEISYRLSQRVAFFLVPKRTNETRNLYESTRAGYSWRSKVVHGLRLSNLTEEESIKISHDAETLLRNTFLRILGDPEMIDRFDGDSRDEYLDSLVFDAYPKDT